MRPPPPPGPDPDPTLRLDRSLVLVGMMGAGKTTVGRRLAPLLGLPFYDADQEIERAAGMTVGDLFAQHGEASFRQGEAKVIARLLDGPSIVLATGGGAVLDPTTRALIKARALSVWIRADLDTVLKRATRRSVGRPLLQNDDPRATLTRLIEMRTPLYSEADIAIDSRPGPHSKTVEAIVEAIRAHLAKQEKAAE